MTCIVLILSMVGNCGNILNRGITYVDIFVFYKYPLSSIMIGEVGVGMEIESRVWSGVSIVI